MVRRRTASPKASGPVRSSMAPSRSAAPPPPMSSPMARSTPASNLPATTPMPMQAPSQGPGLMAQMAATAGGVAIGSAVGHAVGNMMTGGHSEAAAARASEPVAPSQQYSNPCEFEWKQFLECTQQQSDVSLCQAFNEAFKSCQAGRH